MPLSTFWLFFSIPLTKVAIIGDFTTDNGPFIDDRLMVFVLYDGGEWFEASMYADGMRSFHELVSNAIGSSMIAGLASSVDFTNRIVWPMELVDHPLFTWNPISSTSFPRRAKPGITPEISHKLSSAALSAIHPSDCTMEQIKIATE